MNNESTEAAIEKGPEQSKLASSPRRPKIPGWRDVVHYPVIVTIGLIAIVVTLAWWGGSNVSILFGNAEIRRGQLWRLVTSVFLHVGILHLAFDVYWLWILGTTVERVYGHTKSALLMLLLAIGSSAMEFAFASPGVGLSGVGYGLFGLLYVVSRHDDRFKGAIDRQTETLFIAWFFICIFLTSSNILNVGNVAHGAGAIFGVLIGYAIVFPKRRAVIGIATASLLLFGVWGSTVGRPFVNRSKYGGYEEGNWGYEALRAHKDGEAIRWLRDAVRYQPKLAVYWYDLGIAYQRVNDMPDATAAYERAYELEPKNPDYATAAGKKAEQK
jgi:membrane associated rhomboid family serine protease